MYFSSFTHVLYANLWLRGRVPDADYHHRHQVEMVPAGLDHTRGLPGRTLIRASGDVVRRPTMTHPRPPQTISLAAVFSALLLLSQPVFVSGEPTAPQSLARPCHLTQKCKGSPKAEMLSRTHQELRTWPKLTFSGRCD